MAQSQISDTDGDDVMGEPAPAVTLPRGTVIDGTYRVEEQLGAGAGGAVYRAVHLQLGRSFAVKVLADELDAEAARRLAQEARTASAIDHDHIVGVTHLGREATGRLYVVMELLEGEDLRARLARQPAAHRGLPLPEARIVVAQTLEGLAAAHEAGVIHRDIKPANIFLAQKRGEVVVKLVDFGMSRQLAGQVRVTQTGALIGTPLYMAPEQSNNVGVDARADVYSLGVVAYEALCGQVPFEAQTLYACVLAHALTPPPPLRERHPEVPEAVAAVVHRCLEKAPADRYDNASLVARAWAAAWEGGIGAAALPGGFEPPTPTPEVEDGRVSGITTVSRPHRGAASDGVEGNGAPRAGHARALVGLLAAAALLLGWWSWRGASSPTSPMSTAPMSAAGPTDVRSIDLDAVDARTGARPEAAGSGEPSGPLAVGPSEAGSASATETNNNAAPASDADPVADPTTAQSPRLRTLSSAPAGATVSALDGTVLGLTPMEVDISAGPVELRVTLTGHVPVRHTVSTETPSAFTLPLQRAATTRRAPRHSAPLPMLAPR